NHQFHLIEQLLLAGFFGAQVQIKAALLHAVRRCHGLLTPTKQRGRFCRISLTVWRQLASEAVTPTSI
ncbi:hypothetical protein, partial [Comamonas faecalis]|uniref:hypothetical protein n=1 Tax=Comamonas faecalis TaxID=1387849 RepID=UPI0031E7EEF8